MQDGPGDGVRIYLVDDDRHLRVALETVLRRAGHEVRVAENGLEIRSLLQEWPADLVICDMLMPGAEGFEVLRAVRAIARDARFIMISGASGDFSAILGQAPMLGDDAILQKRSEERRVGKACVRPWRIRWSSYSYKKQKRTIQKRT